MEKEKGAMDSMKKIHSLFFPFNWKEAQVSIETLLLINDNNMNKELLKSKITNE
jgi:hypothetical protein